VFWCHLVGLVARQFSLPGQLDPVAQRAVSIIAGHWWKR